MIAVLFLALVAAAAAREPSRFIVGGQQADEGEWPWQLALEHLGSFSCGSSLIKPDYAVCAAHCVGGVGSTYELVIGTNDRTNCTGSCIRVRPMSIVIHPNYTGIGATGYRRDISLIHLESSVAEVPGRIEYAPMAMTGTHVGEMCYITGWGRLTGNGVLPVMLQEAQIDVLSTAECQGYWNQVTDEHVCVFDLLTQARGACNGDSGGPMVCFVNNDWELVGITSWGRSGCDTSFPSVYTRVAAYYDWVENNTP